VKDSGLLKLDHELKHCKEVLNELNPHIRDKQNSGEHKKRNGKLQKVLIANRGEIAKRFFLSLHEEGITSTAVVTDPDKGQSWYDFADEVVFIGGHNNYSDPCTIIAAVQITGANAIYSGYGFLSENYSFVKIIDRLNSTADSKIIFMGPSYDTMHLMGDKISARRIASENSIPLFESSGIFRTSEIEPVKNEAGRIGYPFILKLTAGGGGKGMVQVFSGDYLEAAVDTCTRTGLALYNNAAFYIERLIQKPVHIEVQIFNGSVIGIRKCAVQRRNQKIIEESGEIFIDEETYDSMISIAEKIAGLSGYGNNSGAGTIEFLIDKDTGKFGFLEMNTRLQVEYAVTDQSFDIDLVKAQIRLFDGRENLFQHLHSPERRKGSRNHAIECRIYAEDTDNGYTPSPGMISELDLPTFNGVRCDFGFKEGDRILPMYDPMIGKLIVHGRSRDEALIRLERALQELYIKGVKTNVPQLLRIIRHPDFIEGNYTNNFLSGNNDLVPETPRKITGYTEVLIGGFSEYLRLFNTAVSEFTAMLKVRDLINTHTPEISTVFKIDHLGNIFNVRILQTSSDTFHTFVNDGYSGIVVLKYTNGQADNIILNFNNQMLRIRVDRKSDDISLRMKDEQNKINYYSMRIHAKGAPVKKNAGIVRSPFQGTIISWRREFKIGDHVSAGEGLVILSAMKMETVITAPVNGRVIYIMPGNETVHPGKGAQNDMQTTGRSVQEGEILLRIEADTSTTAAADDIDEIESPELFISKFETSVIKNPDRFINVIEDFISALICGYITEYYLVEMIQRIIVAIKFGKWKSLLAGAATDLPEKTILHFICLKKIFSTSISSSGISFYDELNLLVQQRQDAEIPLSGDFSSLVQKILKSYGYPDDNDIVPESGSLRLKKVFMHLRFAYGFMTEHAGFIRYIINILPHLNIPEKRIIEMAKLLIENEENGKDDSLLKYAKQELGDKFPGHNLADIKTYDQGIDTLNTEDKQYSEADQKLFSMGKRPVELWAGECFDSGKFEEIKIKSIDYDEDTQTGTAVVNRVGARIFTGKIYGKEACFFMKDSRVNSGSTGNLEGLKYAAASYISMLKGWPFYVWNDGAGANIKEGVTALNRGAQGFMMNALQTSGDTAKFRQFMLNNPDPVLKSVLKSVDEQFNISIERPDKNSRQPGLVAVGIGSSAGLDVYGSSQAVIQLMLNSEQSYRVLTGSSVVKSIIGEDVSNYDIGGARTICRVTGIADILAADKIQLAQSIKAVHRFFCVDNLLTSISRRGNVPGNSAPAHGLLNITGGIIRNNIDDGEFIELKKYYIESDSLIGGLAKLGGYKTLIMGTGTHTGLMSVEPVIKARELLKIAHRTSITEILIFGREFISYDTGDEKSIAAKTELMNTLQEKKNLRIHIVTDAGGLKLFYINNTADVVIFIENDPKKTTGSPLVMNNTTFTVSSIHEAFDLSHKLLSLFSSKTIELKIAQHAGTPAIPPDPSKPFDMITSVIEPLFDPESFIEFYSGMNNPQTGPMLVTGLARLNGITVGIIADQPLRKGGAADAYGTEKFRVFTRLLNSRNIPLIMLSNSSGFMPGLQQETLRIQAIGAESLDTNILGEIPVVSVVFNQNYGGRLIQAFNKFLRPGIVYLAFPHSILAVIGVKVAFDLLNRKKYDRLIDEGKQSEAEKLKTDFYKSYLAKSRGSADGVESGLVDSLIPDIKELRKYVTDGLDMAIHRCNDAFPDSNK